MSPCSDHGIKWSEPTVSAGFTCRITGRVACTNSLFVPFDLLTLRPCKASDRKHSGVHCVIVVKTFTLYCRLTLLLLFLLTISSKKNLISHFLWNRTVNAVEKQLPSENPHRLATPLLCFYLSLCIL